MCKHGLGGNNFLRIDFKKVEVRGFRATHLGVRQQGGWRATKRCLLCCEFYVLVALLAVTQRSMGLCTLFVFRCMGVWSPSYLHRCIERV